MGGLFLRAHITTERDGIHLGAVLCDAPGNTDLCSRDAHQEGNNKTNGREGHAYHSGIFPTVGLV